MTALNPYANHGANLENSATRIIPITPDDVAELEQVCKSIRIWNPEATPQTVRLITVKGDDVTLTVPADTLWTEPCVVKQVMETGTGATLVIHGYSD